MRRLVALVMVVTLAGAACSTTDRPPIERVAGNIGASDQSDGGSATDGGGTSDGTVGGASGSASGTTVDGATGGATTGGSTDGTSTPTESSDGPARAHAATAAVDAYFDALEAEDFRAAQRVSSGGPAFMARVRDAVSRYNKERDGATQLSYTARSFQVASNEPTRVTFTGQATLESTTSGPAGPAQKDSARFENPVVTFSNGTWRVTDFRYDGQPLGHFPASSHKELGGVDLRLPGALSFGSSTGLIIDLISDGDHSIKVDKATLHYADGSTGVPKLGALVSKKPAALYFLFDRKASAPTSWTADVTIDGGTSKQTTASVTLGF